MGSEDGALGFARARAVWRASGEGGRCVGVMVVGDAQPQSLARVLREAGGDAGSLLSFATLATVPPPLDPQRAPTPTPQPPQPWLV